MKRGNQRERWRASLGLAAAAASLWLLLVAGCAGPRGGSSGPGPSSDPSLAAEPAAQTPPPLQNEAPPPGAPPGVFTIDRDVAKSISHLLQTDPNLAPVSGDVTVSVDKGVVTLHGNVPSDHDRLEIIERVSKLAGVDQVEDHLRVRGLR